MDKPFYSVSVLLLILLTVMFVITLMPPSQANPTTTIYVDPPSTIVKIGENFAINVSVADVTDLAVWGFKIYYLNNILTGLTAAEGPFLASGGPTAFYVVDFNNNYNETHGLIRLICTLLGNVSGVSGTGTLATITFNAVAGGNTTLSLPYTVLGDSQANPINHMSNDGSICVIGIIDTAITSVIPLKTVVGQGYTININVTAENQGDQTVTFNVTAYANTTAIQTKTLTLTSLNSTTVTFTWNTAGFAKGNYTIRAYAWPVPGETHTADNSLTDGWIIVAMVGDITGPNGWPDGKCDIRDVALVAKLFGVNYPDPRYNPNCDLTGPTPDLADGKIDIRDIAIVAKNFGKTDP